MNDKPQTGPLSDADLAIGPVAAAAAIGNLQALSPALESALDAGLSINELKEVLVQLYAYAGFPRALNALGAFMAVLQQRKDRGLKDKDGPLPGPLPTPQSVLAVGTANQTQLSGAPVAGPLFDFAPAIDHYLKAHLFGDIFARDNLDWKRRELATVAALGALSGVEAQLRAHIRIAMNVGLTPAQLSQYAEALSQRGHAEALAEAGQRIASALPKQ